MKFYFDESGEFSIPSDKNKHAVSIVMGVAISEMILNQLFNDFKKFLLNLKSCELENGEPKGYLLTNNHKKDFCDLLAEFDGISLTPVTLDLSLLSNSQYLNTSKIFSDYLAGYSIKMKYKKAQDQLLLLSKQYKNLSNQQALRIYSIAYCFKMALEHSFLFLSNRGHENSWESVRFEIDRVQKNTNSREEKVFSILILGWLDGWSRELPIYFVKEIHTRDHPLVKKYGDENGVDIAKMIKNNIYWGNSKNSLGLQIADIASNIVFKAAYNLEKDKESLMLFSSLMNSSYYGAKKGPGLFSPVLDGVNDAKKTSKKYKILSEVMQLRNLTKLE